MALIKGVSRYVVFAFGFFVTSPALSQTWICDARAATGFDRNRGFQSIDYNVDGTSYRILGNLSPEQLTFSNQRQHSVFRSTLENWDPAGLQQIGMDIVELCIESSLEDETYGFHQINCDTSVYGQFKFNLETGRYTRMDAGFESSHSSQSWVEVGECRRTN